MSATVEQQVRFLRAVPLLKGFDEALIAALCTSMQFKKAKAQSKLCEEGGPGNGCFILTSGECEVLTGTAPNEHLLCTLGLTSVIGEVSLVDGGKRSATVRCKTDVSYFFLSRDDFERLLNSRNRAGMRLLDNIVKVLSTRVRAVNQRYTDLFSKQGETMAALAERMRAIRSLSEGNLSADGDENKESNDLMKLVGYKPLA